MRKATFVAVLAVALLATFTVGWAVRAQTPTPTPTPRPALVSVHLRGVSDVTGPGNTVGNLTLQLPTVDPAGSCGIRVLVVDADGNLGVASAVPPPGGYTYPCP